MFLYCFADENLKYVKLGRTGNITERFETINRQSPVELKIIGFFPVKNIYKEQKMLKELMDYRMPKRNEWFDGCHLEIIKKSFLSKYTKSIVWPKSKHGELYGLEKHFFIEFKNTEGLIEALKKGEI